MCKNTVVLMLAIFAGCGPAMDTSNETTPDASVQPEPDGPLASVSCTGSPDAGVASSVLSISGSITEGASQGPSVGATVGLYMADETTLWSGSPVLSDSNGDYSVSVNSGGAPVQVVGKFSKSGYVNEWIYAGEAISHSYTGIAGILLTPNDLAGFGLYFGKAYDSTAGLAAIEVVDCAGLPVEGATVQLDPAPELLRYADNTGKPSKTMTATGPKGIVFGWNLPVTAGSVQTVTVSGNYHGMPLASHTFKVHRGEIALTLIHP
jgi:hypothetical protein